MLVINAACSRWLLGDHIIFEPYNPRHPYICCLIIFPLAAIISVIYLMRGRNTRQCRICAAQFGLYKADGHVARLFFHESHYQLRLLLGLSLVLTAVETFYYFNYYIDVNYNSPDRFFFIWMPLAIYGLSLVFTAVRYMSMGDTLAESTASRPLTSLRTIIRFLVFSGDRLLLSPNANGLYDTPFSVKVNRIETDDKQVADKQFEQLTGIQDFTSRYLYSDSGFNTGSNIFHYAMFLPENDVDSSSLPGEWLAIDAIDRKLKAHQLAPSFVGEINRIYRVTMAWKTYDRNGRRLYPIKNYRPTFRLRDLCKVKADYNDLNWLNIATNNEDRPFFRLRKLWRKRFLSL